MAHRVYDIKALAMRVLVFIAVASVCVTILPSASQAGGDEKIIFEKNTIYQYLSVAEYRKDRTRVVRNNKRHIAQGGIYIDRPDDLLYEYTRMSFIALAFLDRVPEKALFVGLGAGSMPRFFNDRYPETMTETVEIDPDMVAVAKKYFHFSEKPNLKNNVSDGRMFLKRSKDLYDVIFLDAYQGDHIPFHMTTVEFLRELKKRLKPDGVVATNITTIYLNKYFRSMLKTYLEEFPNLYVFRGKESGNFIFVAPMSGADLSPEEISVRADAIARKRNFGYDLTTWIDKFLYYEDYADKRASILTDDFAPVNLYRHSER